MPLDDIDLFFTPIPDAHVPSEHQSTMAQYRWLATWHGVPPFHALCYRVQPGFAMLEQAPQTDLCYDRFRYLRHWKSLEAPAETESACVFWVPRQFEKSPNKTLDQQLAVLASTRSKLELPAHHLTCFGGASLLAGLMLAHFRAAHERVPLHGYQVRTDTRTGEGRHLTLQFLQQGLYGEDRADTTAHVVLGAFALGIEPAF